MQVVNKYLPECHSFLGQVIVQVGWASEVREAMQRAKDNSTSTNNTSTTTTITTNGLGRSNSCSDVAASYYTNDGYGDVAKLHASLLNLVVRISMEPGVRQVRTEGEGRR